MRRVLIDTLRGLAIMGSGVALVGAAFGLMYLIALLSAWVGLVLPLVALLLVTAWLVGSEWS